MSMHVKWPVTAHGLRLVIYALYASSSARAVVINVKGSPTRRSSTPVNPILLSDANDLVYLTNISINGNTFPVALDSGSSDLWVQSAQEIPDAQVTHSNVEINYVIGSLTGDVESGKVEIGGIVVTDQRYLRVTPDNNRGIGVKGILGLGHTSLSSIFLDANQSLAATSLAQNIFLKNSGTPNFVTVQLGRVTDSLHPVSGSFTIGETLTGLDVISTTPKLDVMTSTNPQRWATLLDTDGITVNGKPIWFGPTVTTGNQSLPHDQMKVLFDTGSSFSQVPSFIADEIYSGLPGAIKQPGGSSDTSIYHVPCVTEVNMTMSFGGITYPIHPLDMSTNVNQVNGMCLSTFQGIEPGFGGVDIIAGMPFLRNVYLLMNYGENVDGDPAAVAGPFIQMLSTTNISTMHHEFRQARGDHAYTAPSHSSTYSSYVNTDTATHYYTTIPATISIESPSTTAVSSSSTNSAVSLTDRQTMASMMVPSLVLAILISAAYLLPL